LEAPYYKHLCQTIDIFSFSLGNLSSIAISIGYQ